ncbi:MAG TPA: response regulator [Opitutaceae bacterium]|nr:response regulator [Opitutaceae bacterium]
MPLNRVRPPILLVDDSPADVELTLAALDDHPLGCRVHAVTDGEQALDFLQRRGAYADRAPELPSLVLLDLKMPKVDGLEVLRAIRADQDLRKVPVVVLTSSREEQDIVRSYDLGVNAYVVKPVGYAGFAAAVRQLGLFWILHNETVA